MTDTTEDATPVEDSDAADNTESRNTESGNSGAADDEDQGDDAETFPRAYVEELRQQNGKYRQRAQRADTLAQRLHTELVKATGRLADPTDLEFDEAHLYDPDALTEAINDLLERKPHLASRRPTGDIGQGQRGSAAEPFSLLGLLKERT